MRVKDLIIQFEYNYWATQKVLTAAQKLHQRDLVDEDRFRQLASTLERAVVADYGEDWRDDWAYLKTYFMD